MAELVLLLFGAGVLYMLVSGTLTLLGKKKPSRYRWTATGQRGSFGALSNGVGGDYLGGNFDGGTSGGAYGGGGC